MKAKHLIVVVAVLLAGGGAWLTRSTRPAPMSQTSSGDAVFTTPDVRPKPGQMLRPPNPTRRFTEFTPEQRVQFARKGQGPGG